MVLLEKFVSVSRDAGMDGLLHKTRAIIIADVRISRQAYFCSLDLHSDMTIGTFCVL